MDEEYKNRVTEKIISQLEEVYDPEIPINIYDLGLIYEINIISENKVHVLMTLTSPTCPTAEYIQAMVEEATLNVEEVEECDVELTFDPMWSPERVSLEVREEMGFFAQSDAINNTPQDTQQKIKQDIAKQQEVEVQAGFEGVSDNPTTSDIKVCFNCAATQKIRPLLHGFFNNEEIYICTKCISKF